MFIDLLGFGLILPLLPYYAEAYGASDFVTGLLVASYAATQLIGAPVLGRLSDRYGRRPLLLVSIAGTVIGFLILGFAEPLGELIAGGPEALRLNVAVVGVLFVSRILDGLFGGNVSVAQAYMTDVTDEENRARGLGLLGAAFGFGFVFGPAVGGFLSQWGYHVPALVAAGLAAINWLGVLAFLPESLTHDQMSANGERASARSGFDFSALRDSLNRPVVGTLLTISLFFRLAFALLTTIFSLYALKRFNLDAQTTGYLLAYSGVILVVVQGAIIGPLTKRYGENRLIFISIILMVAASLGWAFAPSVPVLIIALTPMSIAGGILSTVLRSAVTKAVDPDEVGGILGIQTSLESATRVIAPALGGSLIQWMGTSAPGLFSAVVLGWLVWYTWRRLFSTDRGDNDSPVERIASTTTRPVDGEG